MVFFFVCPCGSARNAWGVGIFQSGSLAELVRFVEKPWSTEIGMDGTFGRYEDPRIFFFLINTTPGSRKTNRDFRVLVILRVLVLKYCAPKVEGKGTRCNMSDAGETHVKYR